MRRRRLRLDALCRGLRRRDLGRAFRRQPDPVPDQSLLGRLPASRAAADHPRLRHLEDRDGQGPGRLQQGRAGSRKLPDRRTGHADARSGRDVRAAREARGPLHLRRAQGLRPRDDLRALRRCAHRRRHDLSRQLRAPADHEQHALDHRRAVPARRRRQRRRRGQPLRRLGQVLEAAARRRGGADRRRARAQAPRGTRARRHSGRRHHRERGREGGGSRRPQARGSRCGGAGGTQFAERTYDAAGAPGSTLRYELAARA